MVKAEVYQGRVLWRKHPTKRIMKEPVDVVMEYLYLNVTKMYKKAGILYVQVGSGKTKEIHKHEMKRIESIQIREHKRSGVQ
jgi:hypothetical protein